MVINLRCERCYADVAVGPVLPETFDYFQRIATQHNCAPLVEAVVLSDEARAELRSRSGELSPEDLTRLGLKPPLKPVP